MKIPVIAYMAAYNEVEYIRYAIESVMRHADGVVVLEGAFGETVRAGGRPLSDDGTLEILGEISWEYDKVRVVNVPSFPQLQHRSLIFRAVSRLFPALMQHDYWLWLVDADEVYDEADAVKLMDVLDSTSADCIKLNSLTFINDFQHYVDIAFPRCFRIRHGRHWFLAPNHVARQDHAGITILNKGEESHEESIKFFHYSYVKSCERFLLKKRERELSVGSFKWCLDSNGKIVSPGTTIKVFDGEHPKIMRNHPRISNEKA